jgi:hypothetical protein
MSETKQFEIGQKVFVIGTHGAMCESTIEQRIVEGLYRVRDSLYAADEIFTADDTAGMAKRLSDAVSHASLQIKILLSGGHI